MENQNPEEASKQKSFWANLKEEDQFFNFEDLGLLG